jgi:hypothetical protein
MLDQHQSKINEAELLMALAPPEEPGAVSPQQQADQAASAAGSPTGSSTVAQEQTAVQADAAASVSRPSAAPEPADDEEAAEPYQPSAQLGQGAPEGEKVKPMDLRPSSKRMTSSQRGRSRLENTELWGGFVATEEDDSAAKSDLAHPGAEAMARLSGLAWRIATALIATGRHLH